ncbi:MAG: alpha/beta fold hydrolase [Anaerolineales bacterium]
MPWKFPYLGETEALNEVTRAEAPGDFVQLARGFTHYQLDGPENGQPVVLVHGFSVPFFIWDPTFEFLTRSGCRVLRYDLFGRGFSDRPKTRYNIDLFCEQLRDLLDTLGFDRVNLIGLSMGGPITGTFAARYPERVRKLVLIDPAGARAVTLSRILRAALTPGFGELALGLFGRAHMRKSIASDFYDPAHVKQFVSKYMLQMRYKGFMRAILSTLRSGMLGDFSSTYQKVGQTGLPVCLFWGQDDQTVPFAHSQDLLAAIPKAQLHVIENCGHIPHYEKPEEVNPRLLEFLQ